MSGTVHQVNVRVSGALARALIGYLDLGPITYLVSASGVVALIPFLFGNLDEGLSGILLALLAVLMVIVNVILLKRFVGNPHRPVIVWTQLIETLDAEEVDSFTPKLQRDLNRKIDQLARLIATYPHIAGTKDSTILAVAAQKASAILELQQWITMPLDEHTYPLLRERLADDLSTFLIKGWHFLPQPALADGLRRPRTPRAAIAFWSTFTCISIGAAVLAVLNFDKLAGLGPLILLTALATTIYGSVRAGAPISQMREIVDMAKALKSQTGK